MLDVAHPLTDDEDVHDDDDEDDDGVWGLSSVCEKLIRNQS